MKQESNSVHLFSGHRRYPMGSNDPVLEEKSLELMKKCIELAQDLGVRTIQLAGYDVYYEEKSLKHVNVSSKPQTSLCLGGGSSGHLSY